MLEELHERARLELGLPRPDREQGLQLRGEKKPVGELRVVEGLDAEAVAGEHELAHPLIVEGEGKHPVQRGERAQAVQCVGVEDDLAVRARPEAPAPSLEKRPQLHEVVDLAVGDERESVVDHGLVSALEVDDGQARVDETDRSRPMDPQIVGTAMSEGRRHTTERAVVGAALPHEHAGYAAHEHTPFPIKRRPIPKRTERIRASSRPARWLSRSLEAIESAAFGLSCQESSRASTCRPARPPKAHEHASPAGHDQTDRGAGGARGSDEESGTNGAGSSADEHRSTTRIGAKRRQRSTGASARPVAEVMYPTTSSKSSSSKRLSCQEGSGGSAYASGVSVM